MYRTTVHHYKISNVLNFLPGTSYERQQIMKDFNVKSEFIHPRTRSWILNDVQHVHRPSLSRNTSLSNKLNKFDLDEQQKEVATEVYNDIHRAGTLGSTYLQLWVGLLSDFCV